MLCAISGEAPQVPVASRKSGTVYERRLIEAYINEHGKEPTTGEALIADDLIELHTSRTVRPRPPTLTSIPSLLGVFQEEWDALALETYTLKQHLTQTRQELSTTLYQHDAAVRVIARLTQERDEAREALSKIGLSSRDATHTNGEAMQVDNLDLPEAIIAQIDETKTSLEKTRRKRLVPEGWATEEEISVFKPLSTSDVIHPGGQILTVDQSRHLALVAGTDSRAHVYSLSENSIISSLHHQGASTTDGLWAASHMILCTSKGSVEVFEGQERSASFRSHAGAVSGLALHPSGKIVASVGEDKSYALYDLSTSSVLTQVYSDQAFTSVQFHPDGHLLAAGTIDGQIKLFDVKSGMQAATFALGGRIQMLRFSENGIWLAAVSESSSTISIWDLRKMAEIKSLDTGGSRVESIDWDYTGQFLLIGGPEGVAVQQYSKSTKAWTEPLRSATPAVAVAWASGAHQAVTLDHEGRLTVLGAS